MSRRNWSRTPIRGLHGAYTALSDKEARPERASYAQNVIFLPRSVKTRPGFVNSGFTAGGKITSAHYWQTSVLTRLVVFEAPNKVRLGDLVTFTFADVYTQTARACWVAEISNRAYISTMGSSGSGTGNVRIIYPLQAGIPADVAFAPPWSYSFTAADQSTGDCNAGIHKFGYVIESRSGFRGKPGPDLGGGGGFAPVSITLSDDGRTIRLSFTGINVPSDSYYLHPIMTTATNHLQYYYVPDGQYTLTPGGVGQAFTIDISVSDAALVQSKEATENFDYLAQPTGGGATPVLPNVILTYGNRLVYCGDYKVYVSDQNDPEVITEDRHSKRLPNERTVVTGFTLRGTLYLLGPNWTYAFRDNGDYPATWEAPEEIAAIGTSAPFGVCARSKGDIVWVATKEGLQLFNGQYSEYVVSYYQHDWWARINWAAPTAVKIVDDPNAQRVYVQVPLDAATEASHVFVWDYSRGLSPLAMDFSVWTMSNYALGCIELVNDPYDNRSLLYYFPQSATAIRKQRLTATDDAGTAIEFIYETGQIWGPAGGRGSVNRIQEVELGAKGSGTVTLSVRSENVGQEKFPLIPVVLSETPSEGFSRKLPMLLEDGTVRVYQNAVGSWIDLEYIDIYHMPYLM